jgi:hypothetical protein
MNLLLRGFESKEVAENVAAEILKRGVAKSAKVDEARGDLSAAQQEMATLAVAMNEFSSLLADCADPKVKEIAAGMKKVLEESQARYERGMGDT